MTDRRLRVGSAGNISERTHSRSLLGGGSWGGRAIPATGRPDRRQTSDGSGASSSRTFLPTYSPGEQGKSPTRNESAVSAVPRAKGPHPAWSHPSLSTQDPKRDLPQCPWTELGGGGGEGGSGRDRRGPCPCALDTDGQSQTQGGFSELHGEPLSLAAHSILGTTGGRGQLGGHRVGWGAARGRKRGDRARRGCVQEPAPAGPHRGGIWEEARSCLGHTLPFILASSLARPTQQAGPGHPKSKPVPAECGPALTLNRTPTRAPSAPAPCLPPPARTVSDGHSGLGCRIPSVRVQAKTGRGQAAGTRLRNTALEDERSRLGRVPRVPWARSQRPLQTQILDSDSEGKELWAAGGPGSEARGFNPTAHGPCALGQVTRCPETSLSSSIKWR